MSNFASKWYEPPKQSLIRRISRAVRSEGPMKPRLEQAIRSLRLHIAGLDELSLRLGARERSLFAQVVSATRKGNPLRASAIANEVAEVRRINRTVTHCRLALSAIELRLHTVRDLGDVVSALAPATAVISSLRADIGEAVPKAENSLAEVGEMFNAIMVEATQSGAPSLSSQQVNADAQRILDEAYAVAEEKLRDTLPELPSPPFQGEATEA